MERKATSVTCTALLNFQIAFQIALSVIRLQSYNTTSLLLFFTVPVPRVCLCIYLECLSISCACKWWLSKWFRHEQTLTSILRRDPPHVWETMRVRACLSAHHLLATSFPIWAGSSPLVRIRHIGLFIDPNVGLTRSGGVERCQQQQLRSSSVSLSLYTLSAAAWVSLVGFIFIHLLVRQMGRHRSEAILH